jgi:hypothetical protein
MIRGVHNMKRARPQHLVVGNFAQNLKTSPVNLESPGVDMESIQVRIGLNVIADSIIK